MVSDEEEKLIPYAMHDIEEFVKEFAKKYQKLFKSGYYKDVIHPSVQHPFFPFEVTLEIKTKE